MRAIRVHAVLARIGEKHGVSAATLAYACVRRHPAQPRDWFAIHEASSGQRAP